jgi:hypothetical protein
MNPTSHTEIRFLPQRELRNKQVGDYYKDAYGKQHFEIAMTGKWEFDMLILIHELVEATLCRRRKIPDSAIDEGWDFVHPELDEPGADKRAPYHKEHMFAEKIERMVCKELGFSWKTYSKRIDKICPSRT